MHYKISHNKDIFKTIISHLDIILSIIFLFCGIAIITLSYIAGIGQYGLGLAFLFSPIGYLFIHKALKKHEIVINNTIQQSKINLNYILEIFFWVLYSISLVILYLTLYFRPWYYFFCISVAFTILIIQALNSEFKPLDLAFYFFKVTSLSFIHRAGRFFAFPNIPGCDIHVHLMYAKYILDFGRIPPFEVADKYAFTPFWHIYEAIHMLIFNTRIAYSLFFFAFVIFMVIILLTYLITKNLFGPRIGLLASIFICVGDMIFINTLTNINTSLLVMVYFLVLLFCLHYTKKNFYVIAIIMVIALFWTHQLSVFAVYLALLGYFIINRLFLINYSHYNNKFGSEKQFGKSNYLTFSFILFFSIYMIFFWGLISEDTTDNKNFFGNMISRLSHTFQQMIEEYSSSIEPPTIIYENLFSKFNFFDLLFYNLGYCMLFSLALVCSLIMIKKYGNIERLSLLSAMIFLFIIIYPGTYIGLNQLFIPHRFLPFFQLIYIIFSAFSLFVIYKLTLKRISRILQILFVLIMVFFLITAPYINRNDLLYSKSMESRTEIMLSEIAGISWGQKFSVDKRITVDPLISKITLTTIEVLYLDPNNITYYKDRDESNFHYIRSYIKMNPKIIVMGTYGKAKEVDYSQYFTEIIFNHQLVYNNNQVKIYN